MSYQLALPLITTHEAVAMETARMFHDEAFVRATVPALFATRAHPRMSDRYSFTNTYEIIRALVRMGWYVTSVMGGGKSGAKYSKFIVRMRHKMYDARDNSPEIVIVDSHDGTSRLKLLLGIIRLICMNGAVAMDEIFARSYVHLAPDLQAQVILDVQDIEPHIVKLQARVNAMKNYETSIGERIALADEAVKTRFGEDRTASFVADIRMQMLNRRRTEDMPNDMYTIMNVIQENVLRGGFTYSVNNQVRHMQPINAVGRNVHINQALWKRAEQLVQLAA